MDYRDYRDYFCGPPPEAQPPPALELALSSSNILFASAFFLLGAAFAFILDRRRRQWLVRKARIVLQPEDLDKELKEAAPSFVSMLLYAIKSTDGSQISTFRQCHYQAETLHVYENCAVIDFAPTIFRDIRAVFNITEEDYRSIELPDSAAKGSGKSGSTFIVSRDRRFIIKSVEENRDELKVMLDLLPEYHHYVRNNRRTMLVRYYGLYKMNNLNQTFVVMSNVLEHCPEPTLLFDLKGSRVGRLASPEEKKKSLPCFKDCDFVEQRRKIEVGYATAKLLKRRLAADIEFLKSVSVLDYSVLLGIKRTRFPEAVHWLTKLFCETPSTVGVYQGSHLAVYYIGIIDLLQSFNQRKKIEHLYKSEIRHRSQRDEISVLPPEQYATRMVKFLEEIIV